jgi:hypothetical protein
MGCGPRGSGVGCSGRTRGSQPSRSRRWGSGAHARGCDCSSAGVSAIVTLDPCEQPCPQVAMSNAGARGPAHSRHGACRKCCVALRPTGQGVNLRNLPARVDVDASRFTVHSSRSKSHEVEQATDRGSDHWRCTEPAGRAGANEHGFEHRNWHAWPGLDRGRELLVHPVDLARLCRPQPGQAATGRQLCGGVRLRRPECRGQDPYGRLLERCARCGDRLHQLGQADRSG